MSTPRIRFGTDIITFFDSGLWGLPPGLSHPEWSAAFAARPHHYFEAMFDLAAQAGMEGIELAPDPGGWEAALAAYGGTAQFKDALASRGLTLASSYAHGRRFIGDALVDPTTIGLADDAFARHAAFLAEMGASTITMGNIARGRFGNDSPDDTATQADFDAPVPRELHERFAEQVNRLGAIVSREGVRIAIHTDAYSVCSRNDDIATVMSLTDPVSVGLCPDAGHIALDGGDPVAVLRDNIDRVPTMHWKDCSTPLSGHLLRGDLKQRHAVMLTHFRVLGAGTVDWVAWMQVLKGADWSGWAIEEIDNSTDPVSELAQGLAYYRERLASIHG